MSKWFLIVVVLIILSSIISIFVRMETRKEKERVESGELSADDFDIIE